MYSDISILVRAFSSSNKKPAKTLARSVLPTPVGPANKKEPSGLCSSLIPALFLLMALLTALIASS